MLLLLLFLHALAFIFLAYFLAFALVFSSFSLPVYFFLWSRAVVFSISMARAPWLSCGALSGLAALYLVSRWRSSASPQSVLLRA